LRDSASEFCPRQADFITYHPEQGRIGKDIDRPRLAVDLQRIGRHAHSPEPFNLEAM
jgi:hypothetical protein